jgi:hypothetical protein
MNPVVINTHQPWRSLDRPLHGRAPSATVARFGKILTKTSQISSQNERTRGFLTCCVLFGLGYHFGSSGAAQVWEMTGCTKTTAAWSDEPPRLAGT